MALNRWGIGRLEYQAASYLVFEQGDSQGAEKPTAVSGLNKYRPQFES